MVCEQMMTNKRKNVVQLIPLFFLQNDNPEKHFVKLSSNDSLAQKFQVFIPLLASVWFQVVYSVKTGDAADSVSESSESDGSGMSHWSFSITENTKWKIYDMFP